MVGSILAVFVAVESKAPKGADYQQNQIDFIENVKAAGGIAGFATSWEKGRSLISEWFDRFKPIKNVANPIKKA
jgi:hypothetical protein